MSGSASDPVTQDPSRTPTRTDRRRSQTRKQLITGARQLISERGVSGLRLREIAAAADVGVGTLYNHFDTIDDLVAAVASESLETLAESLVPVTEATDPAVIACTSAIQSVRIAYDDPELAQLFVNLEYADSLFSKTLLPYVRTILERGIAARRFRISDVETTAILLTGGGLALMRSILRGEAPPNADLEFASAVLSFLGIDPNEARDLIASLKGTSTTRPN